MSLFYECRFGNILVLLQPFLNLLELLFLCLKSAVSFFVKLLLLFLKRIMVIASELTLLLFQRDCMFTLQLTSLFDE